MDVFSYSLCICCDAENAVQQQCRFSRTQHSDIDKYIGNIGEFILPYIGRGASNHYNLYKHKFRSTKSMTKINIAMAQMQVSDSLEHNLAKVVEYVQLAANNGVDIICLPESFFFMGTCEQEKLKLVEKLGSGKIQDQLQELALNNKIGILAGTLPVKSINDEQMFACCVFIGSDGKLVASYNKIHLFDAKLSTGEEFKESTCISHGKEITTFDYLDTTMGLSVCYDIRFPELYIKQANLGAKIFFIPSAFAYTTGMAHWHVLARARAIENFAYVVAPNQVGEQPSGRRTYGHSLIVSPWGEVVVDMKDNEGLHQEILNLENVNLAREQIPSLTHRCLF